MLMGLNDFEYCHKSSSLKTAGYWGFTTFVPPIVSAYVEFLVGDKLLSFGDRFTLFGDMIYRDFESLELNRA